jgi:integrase
VRCNIHATFSETTLVSIHRYTVKTGGTRYRVVWRDEAGRQRSKTVATMAEARRLDAEVRIGIAPTILEPARPGQVTVRDWLVDWFKLYSGQWSVTTIKQRKSICDKWIFNQLGDASIGTLRRRTILEYRRQLQREGATDKTVNMVIAVLSSALTAAVDEDLLEQNPCRGLRKLKVAPTKRRALDPISVERLRRWMPTGRDQVIVSLLAYAGLRPAEVCALQWRHITDHSILVEQSAQAGMIQRTKTGGARVVPLNPVLAEDLDAYGRGLPDQLVVSGERGGILSWKNWFRRVWVPAARNASVEATPYDLRHTFVSLLLHSGATIPETSAAVGHANATMTLNTYAHVYADAQRSKRLPVEQAIRDARTQLAANHRPARPAPAAPDASA